MSSRSRAFTEKTVVANYLILHYVKGDTDQLSRRRKKVVLAAVDEIFLLHYFPRIPASCEWYREKIWEILARMEHKLREISPRSRILSVA